RAEVGSARADAGNRHHAERDAGDEDVKAAQAAAQFAQGVAQRQRRGAAARGRFGGNGGHEAALRLESGSSIRPERSRTTRSQRCASAGSWVTSTSVMPRSDGIVNNGSVICLPEGSSRLPAG